MKREKSPRERSHGAWQGRVDGSEGFDVQSQKSIKINANFERVWNTRQVWSFNSETLLRLKENESINHGYPLTHRSNASSEGRKKFKCKSSTRKGEEGVSYQKFMIMFFDSKNVLMMQRRCFRASSIVTWKATFWWCRRHRVHHGVVFLSSSFVYAKFFIHEKSTASVFLPVHCRKTIYTFPLPFFPSTNSFAGGGWPGHGKMLEENQSLKLNSRVI